MINCTCYMPGKVLDMVGGALQHSSDCPMVGEIKGASPPDGGGLRFDKGKPRVDLLPADALLELGKVYAVGAEKYAPRNWERGMPWSKVLGPLMRHLFKWMMGQRIDEESGQLHSAMFAWNAIALLTYELRGIGTDDVRPAAKEAK